MILAFTLKSFERLGSIKASDLPNLNTLFIHPFVQNLITIWLVLEGICDLLIAGFQVYYLHLNRSGFKR